MPLPALICKDMHRYTAPNPVLAKQCPGSKVRVAARTFKVLSAPRRPPHTPQDLLPRLPLMSTLLSYISTALSRTTPFQHGCKPVLRFVDEAPSNTFIHVTHASDHILSSGCPSEISTISSVSEDSGLQSVRLESQSRALL